MKIERNIPAPLQQYELRTMKGSEKQKSGGEDDYRVQKKGMGILGVEIDADGGGKQKKPWP